MKSYAVLWCEGVEAPQTGRLRLYARSLEFSGRELRVEIPYGEVEHMDVERGPADRLRGLPVVSATLRDGSRLRIASLEGTGALHEIAAGLVRDGAPV